MDIGCWMMDNDNDENNKWIMDDEKIEMDKG